MQNNDQLLTRDRLLLEVWRELAKQAQQHADSLKNLNRLMKDIEDVRAAR